MEITAGLRQITIKWITYYYGSSNILLQIMASFGVITSYVIKLYQITEDITNYIITAMTNERPIPDQTMAKKNLKGDYSYTPTTARLRNLTD